jgi:hypothetical protein
MVDLKPALYERLSAVQRYSLGVLTVAVALGAALLLDQYRFRGLEFRCSCSPSP